MGDLLKDRVVAKMLLNRNSIRILFDNADVLKLTTLVGYDDYSIVEVEPEDCDLRDLGVISPEELQDRNRVIRDKYVSDDIEKELLRAWKNYVQHASKGFTKPSRFPAAIEMFANKINWDDTITDNGYLPVLFDGITYQVERPKQ